MSWWQLVSIKDEAVGYVVEERTTPPAACPYDGQPLLPSPNRATGALYCPLGNYDWPDQPRII